MKQIIYFLLFTLALTSCFTNVESRKYGVKYDSCSSSLTAKDLTVIYGNWNSCGACCDVAEFPATPVTRSFTKSISEGDLINEEFVIPIGTSEVSFDYNIEFQIVSGEDAKKCFLACKNGTGFTEYVSHNIKNNMRDVFKNVMREFKSPESLIDSTAKFEELASIEIKKRLLEDGITVTRVNLINNFRWSPTVKSSLEAIINTKTKTMESESEAKNAELSSKARITKAEADSRAAIIEARAEAEVSRIRNATEAERIRTINAALTPQYLKMLEIQNYTYKTEFITPQGGIVKLSQK